METVEIFSEDYMLSVKVIDVLYGEPVRVTHWYPIGEKPSTITSITMAIRRVAQPVTYLGDGMYRGADGRKYHLLGGGSTKPAFFQSEPVPPPMQRGRQLPLRWQSGCWEKHTRQGWKIA